jgi:flavin-dependent dehydrogenase
LEGDIWICVHPENGWIWIIPFSNGRTSVGMICDREFWDARPGASREKLFEFLREEPNSRRRLARAVPVTPSLEMRGYSKKVKALHGPGWALAGNTTGFLDPVFSSGVCLALETAWLASTLIDRSLSGEDVNWSREYDPAVNRAFDVFLTFVESWYTRDVEKIFFTEQKLDRIRRFITSILGGNVLRDDNPLADDPAEGLKQLHQSIAQASPPSG